MFGVLAHHRGGTAQDDSQPRAKRGDSEAVERLGSPGQ